MLPWETNLAKETKNDYFRESQWFLEFAGYLDPKLVHHRTGSVVAPQKDFKQRVVDEAMRAAINDALADPRVMMLKLKRFIRTIKLRVKTNENHAGDLGAAEPKRRLTAIKNVFDLNEVEISWKKLILMLPKGETLDGPGVSAGGAARAHLKSGLGDKGRHPRHVLAGDARGGSGYKVTWSAFIGSAGAVSIFCQ